MTAHAEYLDLCAAMALRSLPARDERRLIEHVAGGCPDCEAALEDFGNGVLIVARAAPPTRPGPALRGAVMADASLAHMSRNEKMRQVPGPRTRIGAPNWALLFVPATIIAALIAAIYWNDTRQLKAQIAEDQGMIARVSREMAEASKWQNVVVGPDARAVTLATARAGLRATVFSSPGAHRVMLTAMGLEAASGGRYVLWAMGSPPVALGAIVPDAAGRATLRIERVADATGFLLTRETAGAALPATPHLPAVAEGRIAP